MTRKTFNSNNALESECNDECGYDHSRLRCRKTMPHQRFTRRNSKFLHIDDLYRSDSTITKLFLRINDIALNQTFNNLRRSSLPSETTKSTTMAPNRLLRRQVSMYDKLKPPDSPTNSDSYFQLRTRRHNNCIQPSSDEDSNHTKPMRELRSTSKILLAALNSSEPKVWKSGRPKRILKPKRLSMNESTINNRNHFKVEVKKRRVKGANNKPSIIELSDSEDDKVRNIKKRETELTRLNNEAENFLFPRNKDESSSVSSIDVVKVRKSIPVTKRSFKCTYDDEEESMDSTSSGISCRMRKRRLTQAESFILDNQQYYKFETPGSRLRYQGSYLTPLSGPLSTTSTATSTSNTVSTASPTFFTKNNGDLVSKQLKSEESTKKVKKKYNLDKLHFSFETVPNCEAWYETFQRQDTGEERYTSCYSSLSEERNIVLPYELGSIPPLNPRICFAAYHEVKRSFLGDSPTSRTATCSTPDSCSLDTTSKTDDTSTQSSADFHLDIESDFNLRRRRQTRTTGKTPRKSPRQHASTLAILSSFIQNRRRKQKPILPSIQEEKESKPDYNEITKFFNSLRLDDFDIEVEPDAIDCNVHCKPSAVRTLEQYLNEPTSAKQTSLQDRKTVRKKRTNRTGWPSKSKRPAFKKEGSDSSASIISTDITKLSSIEPDIKENCENDRVTCVNVDLAKWENAERLLTAKLRSDFQPVVRVQKLANHIMDRRYTIAQCSRSRRSRPASPKSPRMLRRPKDKI